MVREVDFTFDEAVRTLGVTPVKLEKLIEDGKLPATTIAGELRIPRAAILQYFSEVSVVLTKDRKGK